MKSLNRLLPGLLVFAALFAAAPAQAGPGDWERLGSRKVSFAAEKDTIGVGAVEGRFDAIKLEVDRGDLEMYDIVVTFGDDSKFSPQTRFVFDQNTNSRTIDLPGDARFIRKVEFLYRSKLRKGHATLTLWGRHAGLPAAPPPPPRPEIAPPPIAPPPPIEARWEVLGTRQVKFRGEKDTIPVTKKEGLFTAIMLEVDNGDLELYDVVVHFGDGSKWSPETRFHFDQGTRSRVIDLPGAARFIKKVDFYYRSTLKKGRALMTLHGRHPPG